MKRPQPSGPRKRRSQPSQPKRLPRRGRPPVPHESARGVALEALRRADQAGTFLRDELHRLFERTHLAPRDRALATQLATGAVRHRRTLRLLLGRLRRGQGRAADIQPALLAVLELGAFQLLFLDRVPDYAAVSEAADAARACVGPRRADKAAGFVNAVLRALGRLIAGRDRDDRPAPDAIPHPEGGVVRLREAVLADPANRAAFLGAAYSYPDWLLARWIAHFGDAQAEALCRWGNRRPHLVARVNPARPGAADLLRTLQADTPDVCPGPRPGTLDLSALDAARLDALLAEAAVTVQDASAMAAVEALAPAAGEAILDLCASPGTKTTQMLEAMGPAARIVACDRTEGKLEPVRRVLALRGATGAAVCLVDDLAAPPGGFDAALVDAPCSNTGVLARRVEVRWRLRPADLDELPRIQTVLLARAAALVRPGGRLVYSTCSLEPEENDRVVQAFLRGRKGWHLRRRDLILPAADHDGAFWALLERE